jgi:hypothetical protein
VIPAVIPEVAPAQPILIEPVPPRTTFHRSHDSSESLGDRPFVLKVWGWHS